MCLKYILFLSYDNSLDTKRKKSLLQHNIKHANFSILLIRVAAEGIRAHIFYKLSWIIPENKMLNASSNHTLMITEIVADVVVLLLKI